MNFSFSIKRCPFIGNDPLKDVYWMILLFPIWWVLGIEQFIYSVVLTLSAFKVISIKKRIVIDKFILLYILFLIVYCISAFYITSPKRYLTFIRNFGAYYSVALLFFIFSNSQIDKAYIKKIVNALLTIMVIACSVGLLGIVGIYRGEFTSLIGYFLPSFITNTTYGGLIAQRSTGVNQWFVIFGSYFRVTSLFLFSTFFASAIAITFPLFWYKFRTKKLKRDKTIVLLFIMLLVINLVFTTARVAIASLTAGLFFIYFFHPDRECRKKRLFVFGSLSIAFILFFITFYWAELQMIFDAVIYARGGGSVSSRLEVYKATLIGFWERPLFGWGTEQDVAGLAYPAGSHSNYLGILYKQGAIGFLLVAGIYLLTWMKISANKSIHPTLNRAVKGTFIIILLNGMTDVLDLDATTFMIAWVVLAIGIYGNSNKKILTVTKYE